MKLDGTVVINTGNFLHVLRIELESAERGKDCDEDPVLNSSRCEPGEEEMLSSLLLQNCELSYSREQVRPSGPHASPIMFLKSPQYFSSEDEEPLEKRPRYLLDSESDDSLSSDLSKSTNIDSNNGKKNNKEKIFFLDSEPAPTPSFLKQLAEAEKAYEFIDENPPDIKLSVFRLRRLADKKYEFCVDEDESENIIPYRVVRQESPVKSQHEGSPQPTSSCRIAMGQPGMQELSIHTSPPFSPDTEDSKVR